LNNRHTVQLLTSLYSCSLILPYRLNTFSSFNGTLTVHHSVELKFTTNLMHNFFYLFNNNIIS
jgi:hypothetical protein